MKRLVEIIHELEDIQHSEQLKLFRMARRAAAHGCSEGLVSAIRSEAWKLCRMNPEDLLYPFTRWEFAFRCGEVQ